MVLRRFELVTIGGVKLAERGIWAKKQFIFGSLVGLFIYKSKVTEQYLINMHAKFFIF